MIRRQLWPTVAAVLMLAILLSLGIWQLERRAWKQTLLDTIAQAEAAPAIAMPAAPQPFAKVRVTGTLRADAWALYGAELRDDKRGGSLLGAQLLGILDRPGAAPILVMLGWVPSTEAHPPAGAVTVDGFIRPTERPGWFAATDSPAQRRFYTLNPGAIAPDLAPFTLVALGSPGIPDPARQLPRPPNDHLGYALTWFSFALILLVIYALHVRKVLHP